MSTTPSTELVPLAQVREAILSGFVPEYTDPQALADEFALRLLAAPNPEELFSVTEAVKAQDILGEVFTLIDARFLRSDYLEDGGLSVYALLSCRSEQRGAFAVTCGGRNVVAQVLVSLEQGWLPRELCFTEAGRETAGRDRPLYLVTPVSVDSAKRSGK